MIRLITISIETVDDAQEASAALRLERRRGDKWEEIRVWTKSAPAAVKMLLCDGERVVVEELSRTQLVYDKEQNMVSLKEEF